MKTETDAQLSFRIANQFVEREARQSENDLRKAFDEISYLGQR